MILGIKLTEKEKIILLSGKETELIKGFTNKEGHVFDAFLSLNGENKLVFRFDISPTETAKVTDNEFDAFKSQVNLAEFALEYGFHRDTVQQVNQTSGYVLLGNEAGESLIVFRDNSSLEYRYFTLGENSEARTIIDFLTTYKTPLIGGIRDEIQRYYKNSQAGGQKIKLTPSAADFTEAFNAVFGLGPLTEREDFYKNDIKDATLDHAFFRGTILNRQTPAGTAVAFPLVRGEQFASVYLPALSDTDEEETPQVLSVTGSEVWLSNVINNQKIRRLVVVYNPVDALAYHQLYSRPSDLFTMFLATCGTTSESQLKAIQEIIDRLRPEQVVLAGDRSDEGIFNNIQILGQLSEPRHFLKENSAWQDENSEICFSLKLLPQRNNAYASLTVKLTFPDLEKGIFMNENLHKYFDHINTKELGTHTEWEAQNPFRTAILSVGKHASVAEIVFPNRSDLLGITEKVIIHLRPLLFFKTEYPRTVSYHQDLQQATESKLAAKESKTRKVS